MRKDKQMLEVELIRNIIANANALRARGIERYPASVEALELLADSIGVSWLMEQANNIKAERQALADMANESQKLGLYEEFDIED